MDTRPLISPCDCKHRRTKFIQSGTSGPSPVTREHVSVCQDCGQFTVSALRNGEHMRVEFTLETEEAVEAAGRYLKYLETDKPERTTMPHDTEGNELKAGDVVTMRFRVKEVFSNETACNVNLEAIVPEGLAEYGPVLTCNTRLTTLEQSDAPATNDPISAEAPWPR